MYSTIRDIDTDWNRRRQVTSNLGAQLILAADPEEHQHSADRKKGVVKYIRYQHNVVDDAPAVGGAYFDGDDATERNSAF